MRKTLNQVLWQSLVASALAAIAVNVAADDREKGRELFMKGTQPACALCHSLQDAGAAGEIGPSLDQLQPDAERVAKAIRQGVGVMPAFPDLSEEEVRLLAKYVAAATQ